MLKFRSLKPEDIDVKINSHNELTFYKNARVDMQILDETVGANNWKLTKKDAGTSIISIYDDEKKEWIEKTGVGEAAKGEYSGPKALDSDALKRAGFAWGIGRELYTTPKITVPDAWKSLSISVADIAIDETEIGFSTKKSVSEITLRIAGKTKNETYAVYLATYNSSGKMVSSKKVEEETAAASASEPKSVQKSGSNSEAGNEITDDTVILIGSCKRKTVKDVKNTTQYKSFLNWALNHPETVYQDPAQMKQFNLFLEIAKKGA